MTDLPDLTPPPDRRLDAVQRERIRSRLARPDEEQPRLRPWLLTGGAAAAVVALIAGVAVALGGTGRGSGTAVQPSTAEQVGPAAGGAGAASPSPTTACTKAPGEGHAVSRAEGTATVPAGEAAGGACFAPDPQPTCRAAVRAQLPGAARVAVSADVSFWSVGGQWVLCYHGPAVTTVHHAAALDGSADPAHRFAFSTDLASSASAPPATLVAGGPLGTDDARISYTFPDGHRQDAAVVQGTDGRRWWAMTYVADTGVLADPHTDWGRLAPVRVDVDHADGTPAEHYRLDWQESGCAQANHGC
jgi:hypothetical protein